MMVSLLASWGVSWVGTGGREMDSTTLGRVFRMVFWVFCKESMVWVMKVTEKW